MSAALVVGHVEISQLRPHVGRTSPVVEVAESPFQVIAGVRLPDPAPPRESVPSPSTAAAPAAIYIPADAQPPADLLDSADIPDEVPERGLTDRTVDSAIDKAPESTRGPLREVAYTALGHARSVIRPLGIGDRYSEAREEVNPHYERVVAPTRPTRREATSAAGDALRNVRD